MTLGKAIAQAIPSTTASNEVVLVMARNRESARCGEKLDLMKSFTNELDNIARTASAALNSAENTAARVNPPSQGGIP